MKRKRSKPEPPPAGAENLDAEPIVHVCWTSERVIRKFQPKTLVTFVDGKFVCTPTSAEEIIAGMRAEKKQLAKSRAEKS